jgi:ankyrin repeat protein
VEVLRTLCEEPGGADVTHADSGGRTCLHRACFQGNPAVVEFLLRREIRQQLEYEDGQGATPLFVAAHEGHRLIVQSFVRRGARVDHAAADGSTPLFVAAQVQRPHTPQPPSRYHQCVVYST